MWEYYREAMRVPGMYSNEMIEDVLARVLSEADAREREAGMSGIYNDAGRMRSMVAAYRAGRNCTIPAEWSHIVRQILRESDPEFAEYQRLAKKFG